MPHAVQHLLILCGLAFVPVSDAICLYCGCGVLDVTIPVDWTLLTLLGFLWSFVPYVFASTLLFSFSKRRTTSALILLLSSCLVLFLNEVVLKSALALPRPSASCLTSYGAPSSHATLSSLWLTFLVLEAIFHDSYVDRFSLTFSRGPKPRYYVVSWVAVFGPVLPARVLTNDHTFLQSLSGFLTGLLLGVLLFLSLHYLFARYLNDSFPPLDDRGYSLIDLEFGAVVAGGSQDGDNDDGQGRGSFVQDGGGGGGGRDHATIACPASRERSSLLVNDYWFDPNLRGAAIPLFFEHICGKSGGAKEDIEN